MSGNSIVSTNNPGIIKQRKMNGFSGKAREEKLFLFSRQNFKSRAKMLAHAPSDKNSVASDVEENEVFSDPRGMPDRRKRKWVFYIGPSNRRVTHRRQHAAVNRCWWTMRKYTAEFE